MLDEADEAVVLEAVAPRGEGSASPESISIAALPPPISGEVARLFGDLEIRRGENGKVIIEASEESARALGALFEGMAGLMRSLSPPS